VAKLMRNKRGLSQVVTTLILLVVSVLLAAVVVYYATNVTMTRTANEEVVIQYAHVWVADNGTAEAAFYIKNIGGRDIIVDKITVRGVESDWDTVWFQRTAPGTDLVWNATLTGTQATDDIPLASSGPLIVYISGPDNIVLRDVGTPVSLTVFTADGQWIKEVIVEYAGA